MEDFKNELEEMLVEYDRKINFISKNDYAPCMYNICGCITITDGYLLGAYLPIIDHDYVDIRSRKSDYTSILDETYCIMVPKTIHKNYSVNIYINKDKLTEAKKIEIKNRLVDVIKFINKNINTI